MTDVLAFTSVAPEFSVDGASEGALARDLRRLDIEESTFGLRTCVAHFHVDGPNSDGSAETLSYLDGETVDLGKELSVVIGPPGTGSQIFRGVVSAIEVCFDEGDAPYVSIYAEDALMRLRLRERTASWIDMTDADVVNEIALDHGLSASTDIEGPTNPVVQQFEESDLAFIRNRAMRLNAELWIDDDDVLHFADREARDGAEILLVQGNELITVHARVDLAHQRSTVTFRGWDDHRVQPVEETASADVVSAETSGGRLGPDVVASVFDEPVLSRGRRDVISGERASAYAEAEMKRRSRAFVTVDGTTNGTPDLVPGARLDLRRVGAPFEGSGYRVTWAHHSYDLSTGYRTNFCAERAAVTS